MFREKELQSEKDYETIKRLADYITNSPGEMVTKFDNFTKYVQTTAISRFLARYEIFKLQLDVPGSIIDLGVARGASLMSWAQFSTIFEPVNYTREIIGFDTFEGVPAIDEERDKNIYNYDSALLKRDGFKAEEGMFEDVCNAISVYDMNRPINHIEKARVIKGDITKTVPEFVKEHPHLVVSLLNLDTDLYEPTKVAISLLYERMPKGGVIIFDELGVKMYPGETVALKDTLGMNSLRLKRFPWATTLSYAVID